MQIINEQIKIKFKTGKEIQISKEEEQELKDYYTKIKFFPYYQYYQDYSQPSFPLITDYPGYQPTYEKMEPYCTCNATQGTGVTKT